MIEDKLKEEFLKYFTLEQWNALEAETKLSKLGMDICDKYLNMELSPIIYLNMSADSKYDVKEDYIAINEEYVDKFFASVKLMVFELRHKYQHEYVKNNTDDFAIKLKGDISKNLDPDFDIPEEVNEYLYQFAQVDAFAFMTIILKDYFDIDYHYPEYIYDEIIHQFIKKYENYLRPCVK